MFTLRVDRLNYFRDRQIVWAGCSEVPDELVELVQALKSVRSESGGGNINSAFLPHLTLLRNVHQTPSLPPISALDWAVRDFRLMRSVLGDNGARYAELGRWPLKDGCQVGKCYRLR